MATESPAHPSTITTSKPHPAPTLPTLPYDILHQIYSHLHTAASLAALAATCRSLHTFTTAHGWQIFLQSTFPSLYPTLPPSTSPSLSARTLTTTSTSYTRRRFHARLLDPHLRHSHQTHGYHPIISTLTPHSSHDILAIAAGPELLLRHTTRRKDTWTSYKDRHASTPGRDDLTAAHLLAPSRALIARANGTLQHIQLGAHAHASVLTRFDTGAVPVRALAVHPTLPRAAAVLAGERIALYDLAQPAAAATLPAAASTQIWSAALLPSSLLLGQSGRAPLALHELTPSGITAAPLREYPADTVADMATSSVFAIAELPGSGGRCVFAGWYGGSTYLHDLRAPEMVAQAFTDPLDPASAVYALHPVGRERLLVGGARHNLLKVFDLRMAGGRAYMLPPVEPRGWATYLSTPGNRRESPVYSIGVLGMGGERVVAGVEGRVWELDFNERGRRREGGGSVMYEFFGRTKLWKQREDGERKGRRREGEGRLDERWEVCDTGFRDRAHRSWGRPRG